MFNERGALEKGSPNHPWVKEDWGVRSGDLPLRPGDYFNGSLNGVVDEWLQWDGNKWFPCPHPHRDVMGVLWELSR